MPTEREVPQAIRDSMRDWGRFGNGLRTLQIFLGVGSMTASLLVATFTVELQEQGSLALKGASFTAALFAGLLTAFNVGGKADALRRAWRHVTAAILRYEAVLNANVLDLIKAYEEAEVIVGDVPFHGQSTLTTSAGGSQPEPRPSPA